MITIAHVGKKVTVTSKDECYTGYVEERFLSKWPEVRTEILINIPGRFPYKPQALVDMGYTINVVDKHD